MKKTATPNEIIFIFEKVLEGWKTIKIYNFIRKNDRLSTITKYVVQNVSTGNSKITKNTIEDEIYNYYVSLRSKVYDYRKQIKYAKE
jgi:hypothetical protein